MEGAVLPSLFSSVGLCLLPPFNQICRSGPFNQIWVIWQHLSFHGARYFPLLLLVSHLQLANGPSIVRACKENIILFSHQPPEVGGKLKLFNLLFNIRTDSFKSRHRQTHYPPSTGYVHYPQAIYTIYRPTHYLHRPSHMLTQYPPAHALSGHMQYWSTCKRAFCFLPPSCEEEFKSEKLLLEKAF